jgi:DedD protein
LLVEESVDTPLPTVDANPRPAPIEQPDRMEPAPAPPPPESDPVASAAPIADPVAAAQPAPAPPAPIAKPPTVASAAPAAGDGARYALQLGIYSNPDNLAQLKRRLSALGITLYEEPITLDGKTATRLRAGPYPNRAAAEADKARITLAAEELPLAILRIGSGRRARPLGPRVAGRCRSGFFRRLKTPTSSSSA